MFLYECEGKELFKKYDISVPDSVLLDSVQDVDFDTCIVKAQVKSGGRGKAGLIEKCSNDVKNVVKEILRKEGVEKVLVEEAIEFDSEMYLSVTLDRFRKDLIIVYSSEGGIDIENSKNVLTLSLRELDKLEDDVKELALKLVKLAKNENAWLVEINPLVRTDKLIALDSKIMLDDNAYDSKESYNFVKLDGNIGVIGNGAGMVMSTLDVLNFSGCKAANFLDLSGGASSDVISSAINTVLNLNPKVLFFNIFGGIVRCDLVAEAIAKVKSEVPFVVRMTGTNEKEGLEILNENGIHAFSDMYKAVKKVVDLSDN
jgi:succinyl-CoA synthetase beta subunit